MQINSKLKKLNFLVSDIMTTLHIKDTEENRIYLTHTLLHELADCYREGYKRRAEMSNLEYDFVSEANAISDFMDYMKKQ